MRKLMLTVLATLTVTVGAAQVVQAAELSMGPNHSQSASPGWHNGWNQDEQAGS